MTLSTTYQDFLANPTSAALASGASYNYIPTLTTINEPAPILKHIAAQAKQIKKKNEKVLNAIEGGNQLCVEVGTTFEIINSGGAYLPGLDDNFLCDKVVTLPIIHIVVFDQSNKIRSIRLHWEQASLLKQVDVIGARARNWPIRDGKDQIRLIANTASSSNDTTQNGHNAASVDDTSSTRSHASSNASNYTSSSIFQPSFVQREDPPPTDGPIVSPRSASKPVHRDLADILSGAENTLPMSPDGSSPLKNAGLGGGQRIGGGKNFQPIRLFDENEKSSDTPDIKTMPGKFNHFDIADQTEATKVPLTNDSKPINKAKHQSQWTFTDFETPAKKPPVQQAHTMTSMTWEDDEPMTPMQRPIVHKPRLGADPHFEFKDDGTPENPNRVRTSQRGRVANAGSGLYRDNIMDPAEVDSDATPMPPSTRIMTEQSTSEEDKKNPLVPISTPNVNVNAKSRHNTFDPHFGFGTASQSSEFQEGPGNFTNGPTATGPVKKGLQASWSLYDESPAKKQPPTSSTTDTRGTHSFATENPTGIKTQGNGMGGNRNAEHWDFLNAEDEKVSDVLGGRSGKAGYGGVDAAKQTQPSSGFWDF